MKLRVVLFLLVAVACATALASPTCVLLDRSGSMALHYAPISSEISGRGSPLVKELAAEMVNAASVSARPDIFMFDTSVVPLRGLDDTENFHVTHNDTALTTALRGALRDHQYIWLLTDNVQDVPTPGKLHDQDMSQFYKLLRSAQIKSIHIFPVLERADLKQQGVLVYAISTVGEPGSDGKSGFDDQIAAFKKHLSNSPRLSPLEVQELWMKPLDRHALDVNAEHFEGPRQFDVGDRLRLQAKVTITAKPYLYFDESPVDTETGTQSTSVFQGAPCLEVERKQASVSPTTVRTDSTVEYIVTVDYGQVRLHKSLPCIWNAAFVSSRVSRQIDTPLTVRVPKGRFHFTPVFVQRFTADSETDAQAQGKIAGLKALPEELADEETIIPIFVPVQVIIRYPSWPGFVLCLIALLLAGIVAGILIAITRLGGHKERVTVQVIGGAVLPSTIKGDILLVNGREAGHLAGGRFRPSSGVRLEDGSGAASIARPIRCSLADGRKVIITFGAAPASPVGSARRSSEGSGARSAGRSAAAGPPSTPVSPPRQTAPPRRR